MSIKYELSLWRDYPGAQGMQEEKGEILAATDMTYVGRAQNVVLTRSYNGQDTLSFEMPVKVTEGETGKLVQNELIGKIHNKSKIKLWRDELWYNPYYEIDADSTETRNDGITIFKGKWQQGRWYEFIVTTINEGRGKKKLTHEFTCDALYVNELSRTGYGLEFEPDTDIMSASGMGTAHELGKRILDGSGWEYVKTEVFPDYKEQFNPKTGETTKIPVATDQIEFMNNLKQYGYCCKVNVNNTDDRNAIIKVLEDKGFEKNEDFKFDEVGLLLWRRSRTDDWKDYVFNYTKTVSNVGIPKLYLGQDSADMWTYQRENGRWRNDIRVGVNNFSNIDLWKPYGNTNAPIIEVDFPEVSIETTIPQNKYRLKLQKGIYYNSGCNDKTFELGQKLIFKMAANNAPEVIFRIYSNEGRNETSLGTCEIEYVLNSKNKNYLDLTPLKPPKSSPYDNYSPNSSGNSQVGCYWIYIPKKINSPIISLEVAGEVIVDGFYLWDLISFDDAFITDKDFDNIFGQTSGYMGTMEDIGKLYKSNFDFYYNLIDDGGNYFTYIWCPPGMIKGAGTASGIDQYICEFYKNGEYIDVSLPINTEKSSFNIEKISSYNTDKRRTIKGSKSNRYSLLETIAKTFYCFTHFIINHDEQGRIIGQKKVTFCEDLGHNQFNGFNYGVNLIQVNRMVDSSNLVTKMYVENIDNQYTNSGLVAISDSEYNQLHENFIYNFEYYINRGLIDKSKFLIDYERLINKVGQLNLQIIEKGEELVKINEEYSSLSNSQKVMQMTLKALEEESNKKLKTIKWYAGPGKGGYGAFPKIELKLMNPSGGSFLGNWTDIASFSTKIAKDSIIDNSLVGGGLPAATIEAILTSVISAQTSYYEIEAKLTGEININVDKLKSQVESKTNEITDLTKQKQDKLNSFEKRYSQYITEGTWKGDKYIEPDTYYLDATRTMSTSCMPKVSYKMNVLDLSQLINPINPNEKNWGQDFIYDVGDTTYIKDEELFGSIEQKAMVSEKTIYIDTNKPDDIELQNYETRFEELFKSIAAAVTTLTMNENIYSRAANFGANGAIDGSILQKSFNQNKELVISSANNSVVQDNRGLTITNTDGTGEILRAIAGGIYFSKDSGLTYTLGISADGINASLITAGQIDTSKIIIRAADNPRYVLNHLGLTAYSDYQNSGLQRENSFIRFDKHGIYMTNDGAIFNYNNWWTGFVSEFILAGPDVYLDDSKNYYINYDNVWEKIYFEKVFYDTTQSRPYYFYHNNRKILGKCSSVNAIYSIFIVDQTQADVILGDYRIYEKKEPSQAERKIQEKSIFSLTKLGLKINSQSQEKLGGSLLLSTEDATFRSIDENGNLRVKIGYIRDDGTKKVHGIDIYNGAFRLYGVLEQNADKAGSTNAAIYFDGDQMIVNADLIKNFGDEGSFSVLTDMEDTRQRPVIKFELNNIYNYSYQYIIDTPNNKGKVPRSNYFVIRPNIFSLNANSPGYEIASNDWIAIKSFLPSVKTGYEGGFRTSSCWMTAYGTDKETETTEPLSRIQITANNTGQGYINIYPATHITIGQSNTKGELNGTWTLNGEDLTALLDNILDYKQLLTRVIIIENKLNL